MQTIYWLALFVILLIIEIITMGLTTIWFAGGALFAFFAGMLGLGIVGQVVVFLVVSLALLVLTRPLAVKFFNQNRQHTNADRLIGQQALVLEDIDTLKAQGMVKINGQEWSARTEDGEGMIPKDTSVIVQDIRGVKLIVKAKED